MSLRPDSLLHYQRAVVTTFNHRCTIQRDANQDDTGWGDGEDWQPLHADLPCEYWVETSVERIEVGRAEVLATQRLVVPYGTNVAPGDQIVEIRDAFGTVVSNEAHNIRGVIPRLDEFELQLGTTEAVSGEE